MGNLMVLFKLLLESSSFLCGTYYLYRNITVLRRWLFVLLSLLLFFSFLIFSFLFSLKINSFYLRNSCSPLSRLRDDEKKKQKKRKKKRKRVQIRRESYRMGGYKKYGLFNLNTSPIVTKKKKKLRFPHFCYYFCPNEFMPNRLIEYLMDEDYKLSRA